MSKLPTFTYQDIVSWDPCYDPIKFLSKDWEGTAIDILKMGNIPAKDRLWAVLREECIDAKTLRLFAVWNGREALSLIDNPDARSIEALNVAERYANGEATKEELKAARVAAWDAAWDTARSGRLATREAARAAECAAARDAAVAACETARYAAKVAAKYAERVAAWVAAKVAAKDAKRVAAWVSAKVATRVAAKDANGEVTEQQLKAARETQVQQLIKILEGGQTS